MVLARVSGYITTVTQIVKHMRRQEFIVMTSQPPETPSALSTDIRLLGNLLGMVIRDQHGQEALDLVERVRRPKPGGPTSRTPPKP